MSDFNSLVQYTVENISRPVKYIIYKLTEFIRVVDKFVFRQVPSGAASGYATIEQIEGNTVAWNQLVDTSDTSCTVPNGHKYYSIIGGTKSISTSDGTSFAVTGGTDVVIDLTQMFGAGNEPTTVADFEAWLAQNGLPSVADYNAGELLSVKMSGIQTEDSSQQTLDTIALDVTTITGINTSTNVREVIFPQGMKQADYAGTVKDTLDLRSDTATVNVGSRAYQSGDESNTAVITDGTTTYYALTTPIDYTDLQDANGNPLNPRYKVEQGGTEQVLPVNTTHTLCDQTQLIANRDYSNNGDLRPFNGRYATPKIDVRNLNKIKLSYTSSRQLYTAYCTYSNQSLVTRNSQWMIFGETSGVLDVSNVDEVTFFWWYGTGGDEPLPTISALAVDTIPPTTVAPTLTTTYTKDNN